MTRRSIKECTSSVQQRMVVCDDVIAGVPRQRQDRLGCGQGPRQSSDQLVAILGRKSDGYDRNWIQVIDRLGKTDDRNVEGRMLADDR